MFRSKVMYREAAVAILLTIGAASARAETRLAEQEATDALFDCLRGASAGAWTQGIAPTALETYLDDKCLGLKALATEEYTKSYKAATGRDDVETFATAHTDFATRHFVGLYKQYWDQAHPPTGTRKAKPPVR